MLFGGHAIFNHVRPGLPNHFTCHKKLSGPPCPQLEKQSPLKLRVEVKIELLMCFLADFNFKKKSQKKLPKLLFQVLVEPTRPLDPFSNPLPPVDKLLLWSVQIVPNWMQNEFGCKMAPPPRGERPKALGMAKINAKITAREKAQFQPGSVI